MISVMKLSADRSANFGLLMKDIGRLYVKLFNFVSEDIGVSFAEAKVLMCLSQAPAVSQIQLAELAYIEPMSLVRILDRMEHQGWIERRPHPTDRRARQLHLTASAAPMIETIVKVSSQMHVQSLGVFRAEERTVLMDLLEQLHAQLLHMVTEQTDKAVQRPSSGNETGRRAGRNARPLARSAASKAARTQRV